MTMRERGPLTTRGLAAIAIGLALAATTGPASAAPSDDVVARCVDDAANGQRLRDAGRLVEGRAAFVRCAAEACPSLVRKECAPWLADVDERIPTVVVSTRSTEGRDLAGTTVAVDGIELPPGSVGRALPIDPGSHTFIATHEAYFSRTESVVLPERQKGRSVVLVLSPRASSAAVDDATRPRKVPLVSWILGGVAVTGAAGFGVLWWQGMEEVSSLRGTCAPYCSEAEIDEARTPITAARVSLAVGIVAAAVAIAFYAVSRPEASAPKRASTGAAR